MEERAWEELEALSRPLGRGLQEPALVALSVDGESSAKGNVSEVGCL